MQKIFEFKSSQVGPDTKSILAGQGILSRSDADDRIMEILDQALEKFAELAHPVGMLKTISGDDFAEIYEGEGMNETPSPIGGIYPRAKALALFAVTVGPALSSEITALFNVNNFALGSMLDSVASESADLTAQLVEDEFTNYLNDSKTITLSDAVLRYSPGYCGWHISTQKKLFEYLNPQQIGISLRESFLMDPLKSISGVLIAGDKKIHIFEQEYPCCDDCQTYSCQDRMKSLR